MPRRKYFAQSPSTLRRSPRFRKPNDTHLRPDLEYPDLKARSVPRRSPQIGKLRDTNSVEDPNLESLRNQARPSTARNCVSPISCKGNEDVGVNQCVVDANRKCFVLRISPRFGEHCVEHSDGLTNKSNPEVRTAGGSGNGVKKSVALRRSSRISSQKIRHGDADRKMYSVLDEFYGNDDGRSDQLTKKNRKKGNNSPAGSQEEKGAAGSDSKGKKAEAGKMKRKRGKGANWVFSGWTKKQEMALERAYLAMKPTPHFWKKVSKMVGKSAQECFDRINYDSHTPVAPRHRSRVKKKASPPASCFSLSASKLLCTPIATRKRKTHLGQKKVRELLQKQCTIEKDYEGDLFSVLEGVIDFPLRVSQQTPGPEVCAPLAESLRKGSNSFSAKKKSALRFSIAAPLTSPPVLKRVKKKALHEKYIDRLHFREAKRREEFSRAKKTIVGKENLAPCCNQKPNIVEAAKHALESDARDVIRQFEQLQNCHSEELTDEESEDEL